VGSSPRAPDTIMGVNPSAPVAAEHPASPRMPHSMTRGAGRLHRAIAQKGGTTEAELAVKEKGKACARACSSGTPLTDEPVEVWVGNYVLMGYGDGAVMGVPGARRARLCLRQESTAIDILQVIAVDGRGVHLRPTGRSGTATSSAASPSTPTTFSGMALSGGPSMRVGQGAGAQAPRWQGKTTWRLRELGHQPPALTWGTPDPDHPLPPLAATCPCPKKEPARPCCPKGPSCPNGSGNPPQQECVVS